MKKINFSLKIKKLVWKKKNANIDDNETKSENDNLEIKFT